MYLMYSEELSKILLCCQKVFSSNFHNKFSFEIYTFDKTNAQMYTIKKKTSKKVISLERQNMLEDKKKAHLDFAKEIKAEYVASVNAAQKLTEKTEVLTFTLQRAFELPIIESENIYYRALWFHNLFIHDEVRNKDYMYVWNETIA